MPTKNHISDVSHSLSLLEPVPVVTSTFFPPLPASERSSHPLASMPAYLQISFGDVPAGAQHAEVEEQQITVAAQGHGQLGAIGLFLPEPQLFHRNHQGNLLQVPLLQKCIQLAR